MLSQTAHNTMLNGANGANGAVSSGGGIEETVDDSKIASRLTSTTRLVSSSKTLKRRRQMLSRMRRELSILRRLLPSDVIKSEEAAKYRALGDDKLHALSTIYGAIDYIKTLELILVTKVAVPGRQDFDTTIQI